MSGRPENETGGRGPVATREPMGGPAPTSSDAHTETAALLERRLACSIEAISSLRPLLPQAARLFDRVGALLRAGGLLCTAGNGGSAAEALHLAEELIGRYRSNRRPWRAQCLNADPTALTCIANDFGFEQVFARQCQALLRPGDGLLVLSTSGASPNIVAALAAARNAGAACFAFLGRDGGACRALCDECVVVPAIDSAAIQEAHQVLMHMLCETLE